MSLNVFITAVCPAPSCGHDYKITPVEPGGEHGREFDAMCANCGGTDRFLVIDKAALEQPPVPAVGGMEIVIDDLRGGFSETSTTDSSVTAGTKKASKKASKK